ncbi:hypothetical protein BB561_000377 [Smittium simulii]|uniref:Vps72/YL1 C-terminal domain-containing protein n=1 Tax=Smittium simulii TaxID=133385 RepID=A0A2T9YZJ5_9FUNG|nr:hypothetical protein BB561_000377 [Smittium simulii]
MSSLPKRKKTNPFKNNGYKATDAEDSDEFPTPPDHTVVYNLLEVEKPFKKAKYKNSKRIKPTRQHIAAEKAKEWPNDFPTFWSIAQAPSLKPNKKYCDITGLHAFYKDPKTNLRYHNAEIYQAIQQLPPSAEQTYLSLRNANVVLR